MEKSNLNVKGPHASVDVLMRGNVNDPKRALLLFHGRGAGAENISRLASMFPLPEDVLVLAPDAVGHAWYPNRFTESRRDNEPYLSSAFEVVDDLICFCFEKFKIKPENIVLAGFSQGACLIADYVARNPKKYAGACIFSGGFIGSDEDIASAKWKGDMKKMPIYLGCDIIDPHIPKERVHETAVIFLKLNATVTEKIYTNLGHSIHPEGIQFLQSLFS